ncbi:metal ABC transporter permease [Edaphobacillus lindanitolerans]|uniref:Zinc transport system permease protein n=1 Tax=Edaphobacillus lindanitolerans TaxID=550447 RepID=A0A1U7PMR5_9BACI|nr:metal ABC transporter permease [Edaphobacillus lindanitolerans]SIT82153.1 zinc transport system permease protein [Edaphobacillus lindanitolerans]
MISAVFEYSFLQNAFASGLVIGIIAPMLGLFIVVRRLSLIADALSHVTLAGIAGSLYLSQSFLSLASLNPIYLGIGSSVAGSLLIGRLRETYKSYEELAIPIIMSGGIAVGAIFISLAQGFSSDLMGYLFGSVSAVGRGDLVTIVLVGVVTAAFIGLAYKELFTISFDPEYSRAQGLSMKRINFWFMIVTALVVASSMRVVGILLVSSLMTLPVAAAMQVAKGFRQALIWSVVFGELSVIGGLFSAFHLDIAPGGTIVVISVLILLIIMGFKRLRPRARAIQTGGDSA